ncbi:MAG: PAS domain-containing sensor histidine kinase [Patescibacteria group bacterium]|nr:PAS domain-containing sensor histidine kinase [Patescibacteria group bacterium]MDD5490891.1 PAS domain-containing sensor histidine kinase [Patescibacteria group bacterium]
MKKVKKSRQIKRWGKRILLPERRIAEQEAIFSSAGDHVMGLVVVNKDGKIIRVNKGFESLTDWKEKEVIGKFLVEIIPREDENRKKVPFKERILSKVLAGKILTTTTTTTTGGIEKLPTFYYIRKDKSRFPATSVISPLLFRGKIAGAVEIFYDITKEKELERIRMDFLSLASHQLRTPLSGTKWLIETMYKGVIGRTTKKQKEYLDDIYKINERMIKLISEILSTLRLESEETLIKKEKISVASLFKDVLIIAAAAAKERGVVLSGPLNHRVLTIETDPEILKAILGCFLSNAVDYSMPGQKVILDVKEESGAVIFFVRDSGIGIPKREQKRMFERFYRASNAKALKPNGTGLGLNIAKMLAEKIGGKISFKSEENKGTTFYLRIPKRSRGCKS